MTPTRFTASLAALLLTACAASQEKKATRVADSHAALLDSLKKRVSFEHSCPHEQISAAYIDDRTVGVTACGNKLVFVLVSEQVQGMSCDSVAQSFGPEVYVEICRPILNSVVGGEVQGAVDSE